MLRRLFALVTQWLRRRGAAAAEHDRRMKEMEEEHRRRWSCAGRQPPERKKVDIEQLDRAARGEDPVLALFQATVRRDPPAGGWTWD